MARKSGSSTAKQIKKKYCSACQQEKRDGLFYVSYNPLHSDGRMPICKECIRNACYGDDGEFNIDNLYSILRQLDRPFLQDIWESSVNEVCKNLGTQEVSYDPIIGKYIKNISIQQHRAKTWADSCFESKQNIDNRVESSRRKSIGSDQVYYLTDNNFEVTEDIIKLFGEGCTAQEYKVMLSYYDTMKNDYPNITESQKKLLLRYVRAAAREEIATNSGNTAEAEKWGKLSSDALKQLNQSDLQGGISSFSEFFQKVERTKDVIRILPKYRYRPNDALDFVIWCFINYCRRLEGKTECAYEDVYKFYDEKVAEYIQQYGDPYGIFADDPTVSNRERIKEFITLPPDYNRGDE